MGNNLRGGLRTGKELCCGNKEGIFLGVGKVSIVLIDHITDTSELHCEDCVLGFGETPL